MKAKIYKKRKNRNISCPALYTPFFDHKQLKWEKCEENLPGSFIKNCPHFPNKSKCWEQYDNESLT